MSSIWAVSLGPGSSPPGIIQVYWVNLSNNKYRNTNYARIGIGIMEKQYTYDLQFVFDGTGDAMVVQGFKSYLSDPEQVKIEAKRLTVIHVYPQEGK